MNISDPSPGSLGYSMPPEWHTHSATMLHWPSNRETWPGGHLQRVENTYLDIIEVLHKYEPVLLLVADSETGKRAESQLKQRMPDFSKIHILQIPLNDVWVRDCGPIFIHKKLNGSYNYAITDWKYNAWGEKYPPFDDDNRIPQKIADEFGIRRFKLDMILEGGSIDVNGAGVLLTTESVLLNSNRNPKFKKPEIEKKLKDYLGIKKIIWLKDGLKGDDTDGHIDDLSRFTNQNTIFTALPEDKNDVNYSALKKNLEVLKKSTDPEGEFFKIKVLPLPKTKIDGTTADGSEYVPASYINFYIANGVVLLPLYDERFDEQVIELFQSEFPDRSIEGIQCHDLVWGQGGIHCITQQLYGIYL